MDCKKVYKFVIDDNLNHYSFGKARLLELSWKNNKTKLIYQKDGYGPKLLKLYLDRILNSEELVSQQGIEDLKNGSKVFCSNGKELIGWVYENEKNNGRKAIRLIDEGVRVAIKEMGINYYSPRNKILSRLIKNLHLPSIKSKNRYFLGISGFPGAGKTTLTDEIQVLLEELGYNVIVIKQDDFRIAKKERYNPNGSQKHPLLPLINQWHDWNDILRLVTDIKLSTGEQTFTYSIYKSRLKATPKSYKPRGYGDIILIDGAFIFNVGNHNIYGVASGDIKKELDNSLFIYRGSPEQLDIDWIIKPIFQREKINHPEKSDKANYERASQLAHLFIEDIKFALPFWQQANIYFDNTNLDLPQFTIH